MLYYLTKSRFKLALECPTKLYYERNSEYANQQIEDSFLQSLADGGFQVGELAKQYYPGGHKIDAMDYKEALEETNESLKLDKVIIYEAAICFENLFIRVDLLIKDKEHLELIEVKAKSVDLESEIFLNKNGSISSEWKSYLYDIAFQKHVASKCFPNCKITADLMLVDKNAKCPTDGLNQKFKIIKDEKGRKKVKVSDSLSPEDLKEKLLVRVNTDDYCSIIYGEDLEIASKQVSFAEYIDLLAKHLLENKKIISPISKDCDSCEFKASEEEKTKGKISGFEECWKNELGWDDKDFKDPTVLELWSCRNKNKYISEGRIKLLDISEEDLSPSPDKKPGISSSERRWLQVEKVQNNDSTYYIDEDNLKREMSQWIFPLHFIDFETSMVAIPFNKGRHPYEGIAFQFSHHIVYEDGNIEHKGEYLNTKAGVFPNYDFLRSLKKELDQDQGSIFRYAAHENTYLNIIYEQLMADDNEISDREELCDFVRTITKSNSNSQEKWEGSRNMIDMLELVKRYYYHPYTKGSNSIKQVLPAILNSSKFLQEKYSKSIYGAEAGIKSLNFKDWKWVEYDKGEVIDPYKLLPKMFENSSSNEMDLLSEFDIINDGGGALTAYARMQFEEMTDYERSEIEEALLKYCELDTLAMVMIYEGWKDLI